MFKPKALLLALVAASAVLAGCSDGGSKDDRLDSQAGGEGGLDQGEIDRAAEDLGLDATDDTGIVLGVVVDDAIRPIEGANVTVETDAGVLATTSNAAGAFGFEGLAPGTYFVAAAAYGFEEGQTSVEVFAGVDDPDVVQIMLTADPGVRPYVELYKFEGFIECSFSLVLVRFAACSDVGNDHFLEEYSFTNVPEWIQSEMIWDSTQQLGDEMQLSITDFSTDVQVRVNASAGPSPQYITVNATQVEQFGYGVNNTVVLRVFNDSNDQTDVVPEEVVQDAWASSLYDTYNGTAPQDVKDLAPFLAEDCIKYPTLFDACLAVGGVGATLQQEFAIYTHVFFNFGPEAGWRFSEAGDPAVPEA